MNLKIDRVVFAQALSEVASFIPNKPTLQILKYAKITTKGNRIKIEANDTQCALVKYIETIENDEDGTFLVEAGDINKFISKIKSPVIDIAVNNTTVQVKHERGTAEFAVENADYYPSFKVPADPATEIAIPSAYLSDAISKAKGFVSTDTLRPQLCAIFAYVKDGEFGYCATDTHKLIHGHEACESIPADADIHWYIMPSVFSAIQNACKKSDTAKVSILDTHASYRMGGNIIQTTQAKGNFPNFKRVIPQTWNMECSVNKSDLTEALSRVALFCDNTECVKLDISNMDMSVSVDNLDLMRKSNELVAHNGCNGTIKIGLNVHSAMTSANVFGNDDILMRMTDATRPVLMTVSGDNRLQVICMPMSLTSEQ